MDNRTQRIWSDNRVPSSAKKGQFYAHLSDDLLADIYDLGCYTKMGQTEFLKRLVKIAQSFGDVEDADDIE